MYTLYVIPGSHACRSAMLMLEHKRVPYRRVDIVTLLHPLVVRLHGFDAGGQTRTAGGRRTLGIRLGDRVGTVPALAANGHRISTNHGIARFLDQHHPEPALFPADPEQRAAVEEAEHHVADLNAPASTLRGYSPDIALAAGYPHPPGGPPAGRGRNGRLTYRRDRRVVHRIDRAAKIVTPVAIPSPELVRRPESRPFGSPAKFTAIR
jgi:glutathione S-transferase